jgi:spermidine/putrescine transport system substrate-binding protein
MTEPDRVSVAFVFDATSPRFNRRAFMKTMAFASAAGFALAACGSDDDDSPSGSGGNDAPEPKSLNFYNWTDYIAEDTIPGFEQQSGIKVTYDNYSSNDELLAKMQAGGSGYDIIVPTDSYLPRLKAGGLLEKLDLGKIPNVTNLDERFRNALYDPGNEYSIPWQWGTTGIGFDKRVAQGADDWNVFDLPEVRGKSAFLDEARDAFGMALIVLGRDPNSTDDGDLDDAREWLKDLKGKVKSITSDYQEPLGSGELVLAQAYSGDVFQLQPENKNLEYAIPKSGAFQWVDAMVIPKDAPHPNNAHAFMNYILDPKIGAALTNYVQYGSPNKAAEQFIDKEVLDNPLIYPPADVMAKLVFQKDLGDDELKYSDRWTEVKTS